MLLAALLSIAAGWLSQGAKPSSAPEIRCVVVDQSAERRKDEISTDHRRLQSAQLLILTDGTYMARVRCVGELQAYLELSIYRSHDKGEHWARLSQLDGPYGGSMFEAGGALYLIGVDGIGKHSTGWPSIRRSTDRGSTWTEPRSANTGRIRGETVLRSCDGPTILQGGRIWHAFTRDLEPEGAVTRTHVFVASAAIGSDLLSADAWRWSNELPLDGRSGTGWERSSLFSDAGDAPSLALRSSMKCWGTASLGADGFDLKDPRTDSDGAECAGSLGVRVERDPQGGLRLCLCAGADPALDQSPDESAATEMSLFASRDRVAWDLRTQLLRGGSGSTITTADWGIDGEDLLVVTGESLRKGPIERELLFLRVPKFRERKFGDASALAHSSGK